MARVSSLGFRLTVLWAVIVSVVEVVIDEGRPAGYHSSTWTGTDDPGNPFSPGIYFTRLEAGDSKATRMMLLMQ